MRSRLGTGRHLDETFVQLPQAVPHSEGVVPPQALVVPPLSAQRSITGGEAEGDVADTPIETPIGGSIFGIGSTTTLKSLSTTGATSALNLLGKVESWGIKTGTQVKDVQLKVANLTGAQLTELLKKLPDGITYELTLNKEEK
jgi:hypothetical protein